MSKNEHLEGEAMKNKIYMITGATSGIGKATILGLTRVGATIVMVCRDRGLGEAARDKVKPFSHLFIILSLLAL